MAYGNIYYSGFQSLNVEGTLYIDKLDYEGTASKLTMVRDSLILSYNFQDWENPIIPLQCEFSLVNENTDFFELLPLMVAEERLYKVRVLISSPVAYAVFDGYLNCEPVSQKYLNRQIINFAASNYLMKLEDTHPISLDTLQNKTLIDIINEILVSTGSVFPVRVNAKLHAEGDVPTAGQTLFNLNGFFTELFWKDDVERTDSLTVLTKILTTFNCYIYWWQNHWYIERYIDMWETSIDYVEYAAETAYSPSSSGTVVNVGYSVEDLNDNVFTGQTQTLRCDPGMKIVKINLNDQRYLNLTNPNFLGIIDYVDTDAPVPSFRRWLMWGDTDFYWDAWGQPKNDIAYSIRRTVLPLLGGVDSHRGLYCMFKTTIASREDQLNISFKYCFDKSTVFEWSGDYEEYTFKFHWYLRVLSELDYIRNSGDDWNVYSAETEPSWVQEVVVSGTEFDEDTDVVTVSITVPLGRTKDFRLTQDAGYLRGDQSFVLCIGTEDIYKINAEDEEELRGQPRIAWIGDVVISTTGKDQNNVIEGTANTKYLNKLEVDLDLYDAEIFDYKNALLRSSDLSKRTERWGTTGGETAIVSRGVCWSISNPPTLADSFSEDGTGFGEYESQLTNLTPDTLYYYRAYATDADGTTVYGDVKSFTSEILAVGHKFQGGIIGYIFTPADQGYVEGEIHGIIVAIEDQNTRVVWGRLSGSGPFTCGAYSFLVGDGPANTAAIEANSFQNPHAIRKIVDYVYEGFTDWFLPTYIELAFIHPNREILGFAKSWYWSSTEVQGSWKLAYAVNMGSSVVGGPGLDTWKKNNYMRVRACRYF